MRSSTRNGPDLPAAYPYLTERTRAEAIRRAATAYVAAREACRQMTPREQAEAAYTPTGPTVDELEDRIRRRRGLPPLDRR